jgi:hypothetical protein
MPQIALLRDSGTHSGDGEHSSAGAGRARGRWLGWWVDTRWVEPPRGIEPRTYALREHSDVSATRASLDLTRPSALGVPLTRVFWGFADSMRTQLSDSSRIRLPVAIPTSAAD